MLHQNVSPMTHPNVLRHLAALASGWRAQLENLQGKLRKREGELNEGREKSSRLISERDKKIADSARSYADKSDALAEAQVHVAALTKAKGQLESQIARFKLLSSVFPPEDVAKLQSRVSELESQVEGRDVEVAKLKAGDSAGDARVARLERERDDALSRAKETADKMRSAVKELGPEIMMGEVDGVMEDYGTLTSNVKKLTQKLEEVRNRGLTYRGQRDELRRLKKLQEAKNRTLQMQLANIKGRLEGASKIAAVAKAQKVEVEKQVEVSVMTL